jgi:DNA-binding NarL/FixJ family response regulator
METPGIENNKVVESNKKYKNSKTKTRIMIVNLSPLIKQRLTQLISQEPNFTVCSETENADQALKTVEKEKVDLVIVGISPSEVTASKVVENIKLGYPNLPILMLSVSEEIFCAKHALQYETEKIINHQQAEKIIRAICYIESLLKGCVGGFTILVKLGKSINNKANQLGQ